MKENLFGEALGTATLEPPHESTLRELARLGVPAGEARKMPRGQAFAVAASMKRRAPSPAVADVEPRPAEPKAKAPAGTARVPLMLLAADADFWTRLLAEPDLSDERLGFAVGLGVLDLPRPRLIELAREIQALGLAMPTTDEIDARLAPRREAMEAESEDDRRDCERAYSGGGGERVHDRGDGDWSDAGEIPL